MPSKLFKFVGVNVFILYTLVFIVEADLLPRNQEDVTQLPNKDPDNPNFQPTEPGNMLRDSTFLHAFIASFSVIVVSELGDKTFFIAAIMAMKYPRLTVFLGAISALAFMTVLSAFFGIAATVIPKVYTHYISIALFVLFGLKMLYEGYKMSPSEAAEELEGVQSDLRKRETELMLDYIESRKTENKLEPVDENPKSSLPATPSASPTTVSAVVTLSASSDFTNISEITNPITKPPLAVPESDEMMNQANATDPELGTRVKPSIASYIFQVFMQAFTMTFVAEWGDRSQLTTIILSAKENVYGVIVGGVIGHSICTGLAVIGGRMIAQKISVKTVTLVGGVVFLIFAVTSLIFNDLDEGKP